MTIDRIEWYSLEPCAGGVTVRMHNAKSAAGLAAVSLVTIVWSGWYGPFGPHYVTDWTTMYWLVTGFFSLTLAAALAAAAHRWECVIFGEQIVVTKTTLFWRSVKRSTYVGHLRVRLEEAVGSDDSSDNIFPCRVRLVDGQSKGSTLWLYFQHKANANRFIDAMEQTLPVQLEHFSIRGKPLG